MPSLSFAKDQLGMLCCLCRVVGTNDTALEMRSSFVGRGISTEREEIRLQNQTLGEF